MSAFVPALLFALLAAVGNAVFFYSLKRAELAQNPLLLLGLSVLVSAAILLISTAFMQWPHVPTYVQTHGKWVVASGLGLTATFVGFHFLVSRYGASYYSLYAVLAILTTSVGVGYLVLREPINGFIIASTAAAFVSILLLGIGVAIKG